MIEDVIFRPLWVTMGYSQDWRYSRSAALYNSQRKPLTCLPDRVLLTFVIVGFHRILELSGLKQANHSLVKSQQNGWRKAGNDTDNVRKSREYSRVSVILFTYT